MKNVEVTMAIAAVDLKALGNEIKQLERTSKNVSVVVLEKLRDFDDECGWHLFGCKSLFEFCTTELNLLKCAAWTRMHAVRLLRAYPQVADYLRVGRLTMSTLVQLRKVVTTHEPTSVFARCLGKTYQEVAKIVAELDPQAGRRTTLRRYPSKKAAAAIPVVSVAAADESPHVATSPVVATDMEGSHVPDPVPSAPETMKPPAVPLVLVAPVDVRPLGVKIRPINGRDHAFNGTVDQDFVDDLNRLRQLESHAVPNGDYLEIIRRAIQIAIEYRLKKKAAQTAHPRSSRPSETDSIPAAVKRAVWERDGGCCAWVYPDGRRCGSHWLLEFDHIVPLARGGRSILENVRLLCRDHNEQHERDVFGIEFVKRKQRKR